MYLPSSYFFFTPARCPTSHIYDARCVRASVSFPRVRKDGVRQHRPRAVRMERQPQLLHGPVTRAFFNAPAQWLVSCSQRAAGERRCHLSPLAGPKMNYIYTCTPENLSETYYQNGQLIWEFFSKAGTTAIVVASSSSGGASSSDGASPHQESVAPLPIRDDRTLTVARVAGWVASRRPALAREQRRHRHHRQRDRRRRVEDKERRAGDRNEGIPSRNSNKEIFLFTK